MDFKQGIKDAWAIIRFDSKTMQKVARQPDATSIAILIIVIAGAVYAVGGLQPFALVSGVVSLLISSFIWIGLTHLIAKLFGGTSDFKSYYKTSGYYYLLSWVAVIPFIGPVILAPIAGIYQLFVAYSVVKNIHGLTPGKAALTIIIPIVIAVIIGLIFAASLAALLATAGLGAGLAESGIAF